MQQREKFWRFAKKDDKIGELFLYGDISNYSWWGDEITPKNFKADLDALGDIDELHVFVNSGGGNVFAGAAIISILQRHKSRKVGYNDGLAASMAFDIMMSMDEVVAMSGSMFMTHCCWTLAYGNRHELRKQAEMMEKIDGQAVDRATKRSGKSREEMAAIQDAETWYTAEEAVREGFADRVMDGSQVAASLDNGFLVMAGQRFEASRYKNLPGGIPISEKSPCNGGESQPVEDTRPKEPEEPKQEESTAPDALRAQRADFKRIREKLLEV